MTDFGRLLLGGYQLDTKMGSAMRDSMRVLSQASSRFLGPCRLG